MKIYFHFSLARNYRTMPEKKTTKKITKKPEEKIVVAKAVEKKEDDPKGTPTPVFVTPEDLADTVSDEEISKEIAEAIKENTGKADRYFETIGRRKTAVARIRLYTKGDKEFIVNNKSYQKYFALPEDQETAIASMKKMKCLDKFRVTVVVKGGGHSAQAEAIRHGTARVLVDFTILERG